MIAASLEELKMQELAPSPNVVALRCVVPRRSQRVTLPTTRPRQGIYVAQKNPWDTATQRDSEFPVCSSPHMDATTPPQVLPKLRTTMSSQPVATQRLLTSVRDLTR